MSVQTVRGKQVSLAHEKYQLPIAEALYVVAVKDVSAFISKLSIDQQQQFLAMLSNYLTVVARGFAYRLDTQEVELIINSLQGLNEMQHQISGSLAKRPFGQYPVSAVLGALTEKAERHRLSSHLNWALERTMHFSGFQMATNDSSTT